MPQPGVLRMLFIALLLVRSMELRRASNFVAACPPQQCQEQAYLIVLQT
jgi:hypothetical protein